MRAIITNNITIIKDPTTGIESKLNKYLSFKDRAAEYALRKNQNKSWYRRTKAYHDNMAKLNRSLLYKLSDGSLAMPTGFAHLIGDMDIEDRRVETGSDIPLPWVIKPYDPREYQDKALELMRNNYRGIINFATGLGKTLLAIHAIKMFKKKTLIVVPGSSIGKQFYKELVEAFGENKVGFYGDGKKKIRQITVGIAASVNNHAEKFQAEDLGLIIFDECHHTPAETFYNITQKLGDVGRIYGLTATDFRSDGKDAMITAGCGDVLIRRDIVWGVENKFLAEPIFFQRQIDTSHCRNYKNDKLKNYKAHVLNCDAMKSAILNDIEKFISNGQRVLCLVDEVEHGREISEKIGIPFATGQDKKSQSYVDQFNNKQVMGLVGTDGKIGEGTNTKPVDVLILANFVASKGPVIQAIGRGLRMQDGKTHCYIIDYNPTGSDMLSRHAKKRLEYFREITQKVKII